MLLYKALVFPFNISEVFTRALEYSPEYYFSDSNNSNTEVYHNLAIHLLGAQVISSILQILIAQQWTSVYINITG